MNPDLKVLTEKIDIDNALLILKEHLKKGAQISDRVIGWQGGNLRGTVHWHPRHNFWVLFGSDPRYKNRHLCLFGMQDPTAPDAPSSLSITCQINPPRQGINRRIGGVFLEDPGGEIFLGHLGNVGGGARKGIGKSAFRRWFGEHNLKPVVWPDGKRHDVVLLGAIKQPGFKTRLASYLDKVRDFKVPTRDVSVEDSPLPGGVTPEFSGRKQSRMATDVIESSFDHGYVVKGLAEQLREQLGFATGSDQERDLYTVPAKGQPTLLFEVKTSSDSQSIYTGVGRLMLHGLGVRGEVKRVLVVPEQPNAKTAALLRELGIECQVYRLDGTVAHFPKLESLLAQADE